VICLGVDWGTVRVGVAASDALGLMAHPVTVLENVPVADLPAALLVLARERGAEKIVLGLPKNMDGAEGPSAVKARDLAKELTARGAVVELWDERLTTWEAERVLRDSGGKPPSRRKKDRDALAACLILQGWLDAERGRGA
jgi:putative Holliday junction resolvase